MGATLEEQTQFLIKNDFIVNLWDEDNLAQSSSHFIIYDFCFFF